MAMGKFTEKIGLDSKIAKAKKNDII